MRRKRKLSSSWLLRLQRAFRRGRHPVPEGSSSPFFRLLVLAIASVGVLRCVWLVRASETGQAESTSKNASSAKEKERIRQFLLIGTVYVEPGFALSGAEIQVRRAEERKVRWKTVSNTRGDFDLRVPKGAQYQVAVSAKCCTAMTRDVDARNGDRADLVFKLQPKPGAKKE